MGTFKADEKLDRDAVAAHIEQHFPDMTVKKMGTMFSIGDTPMVGTWVAVNGKKVNTIPMMHGILWVPLLLLLLATVVGFLIYAVIYIPKQKAQTDEIDKVLASYPGLS